MPQLDIIFSHYDIACLIVIFFSLMFLLRTVFLPKISTKIKIRDKRGSSIPNMLYEETSLNNNFKYNVEDYFCLTYENELEYNDFEIKNSIVTPAAISNYRKIHDIKFSVNLELIQNHILNIPYDEIFLEKELKLNLSHALVKYDVYGKKFYN